MSDVPSMSDAPSWPAAHLRPSDVRLMGRTLAGALAQQARYCPSSEREVPETVRLAADLFGPAGDAAADTHPLAPPLGLTKTTSFVVRQDNLASSMGHPDQDMAVLGSPDLSLWFEMATNPFMPPASAARHVGVGILTHHLGAAYLDETVAIRSEVASVTGRTVIFWGEARVDARTVAIGTHQRVILDLLAGGG